MSVRRISGRILAAVLAVELLTLPSFVLAVPPAAVASDQSLPGTIVADDSLVRSGPGVDNYYATARLNKGDRVTVIGTHGDWLMIAPPPGSFCYVGKAWVTRDGDSDRGTISQPDAGVRTGSQLNDSKLTRPMHLNVGDTVQIVGDTREYFKIAPPRRVVPVHRKIGGQPDPAGGGRPRGARRPRGTRADFGDAGVGRAGACIEK